MTTAATTSNLTFHTDAYRAGTRHRPHRHDELHFSLVLRGRLMETVGGTTAFGGALSVVAKDAGVVHAVDFGADGARMARLTLRAGTIGALIDDPARSEGWRWTHDAGVARPFLDLLRRADGRPAAFAADDPDLADLLAAFTARRAPVARGRPPAWLVQTVTEFREAWHPRLTVGNLARRAGVHPVYLARCMRRWYGTGVGEELRRLRMRSAAAAIAEGGATVSGVAHAHGFSDEPHLCREFRNTTGMTPRGYRTLVSTLGYRLRLSRD